MMDEKNTALTDKILVIDDDPELLDLVQRFMTSAGYDVSTFEDSREALAAFDASEFDLAIVDINLPHIDGLSLTRMFKDQSNIGIIILSGRIETTDRIIGLEFGADDYLVKPFEPRELLARARSVLRRRQENSILSSTKDKTFSFGGWTINETSRILTNPDREFEALTGGEFEMLLVLVNHPNRTLTRDQILEYLDKSDRPNFDRSIDTVLGRLRRKIEVDAKNPQFIKTVRGVGYMLTAEVRIRN
jgi:two-component system OmpR family response regulator